MIKKSKDVQFDTPELVKGESHFLVQLMKYIPETVVNKTILSKPTGSITSMSVAAGVTITEKNIAIDVVIQIIDGAAEVVINNEKHQLKSGNVIIIPAHATHSISAKQQFKMILTIIKGAHENIPLYTHYTYMV